MNIESLRLILIEELDKLEEGETIRLSELGYSERLLDKLLFDYIEINNETYKELAILIEEILSRINFTGISFDSFKCSGFDFSRLKGISINPQKIYEKKFMWCNFQKCYF